MSGSVGVGLGRVPVPAVSLPVPVLEPLFAPVFAPVLFVLLPGATLRLPPALIPPAPTFAVAPPPARTPIPPAAAPTFAPPPALAPPAFWAQAFELLNVNVAASDAANIINRYLRMTQLLENSPEWAGGFCSAPIAGFTELAALAVH
jgi:hypothetical protein